MKTITLAIAITASLLLTACANMATQQKPGPDNADRLFLKYVEISKRPSIVTADDMVEINRLTGLISARKNECEQRKNEAMRQVRQSVRDNYTYGIQSDAIASAHATTLRQLKEIAGTAISHCDGHGFPQNAVN
jgi:hypothetical protein